jgi:hypothetical protein
MMHVSMAAIGRAIVAVVALQGLMITAYAWSSARPAPRHVPVAITGAPAAVAALTARLDAARPGALHLIPAADEQAALGDIAGRLAYGAIVVPGGAAPPRVLTASAGSPAVAQLLTQLAGQLHGVRPAVTDVLPAASADPLGSALAISVLVLVISSIIGAVALSLAIRPVAVRTAALVAFAAGGGAVVTAITHTWLGVVPGNYGVVTAVFGLMVLAVSATVAGLGAVAFRFGGLRRMPAGLFLGAAIFMLLANPFSGVGDAPENVPGAWGAVGQWLPTGAGGTLLRAVSYFAGSRSGGCWAVLSIWAAIGLALTVASGAWHTRGIREGQRVLSGLTDQQAVPMRYRFPSDGAEAPGDPATAVRQELS